MSQIEMARKIIAKLETLVDDNYDDQAAQVSAFFQRVESWHHIRFDLNAHFTDRPPIGLDALLQCFVEVIDDVDKKAT